MKNQRWSSQVVVVLGLALLFARTGTTWAAQTEQPKQVKHQDSRYDVYVKGIT